MMALALEEMSDGGVIDWDRVRSSELHHALTTVNFSGVTVRAQETAIRVQESADKFMILN